MKQVLLMRHAKSSWKDSSLADDARPLNKRGKETAKFMGRYLRDRNLAPDAIVCSPAVRARETATRVVRAGNFEVSTQMAEPLYFSGPDGYLRTIGTVGGDIRRLLLIGHNPDVEQLVTRFTGEEHVMPTGAIAVIDCPGETWSDVASHASGTLRGVLRPKEIQREHDR